MTEAYLRDEHEYQLQGKPMTQDNCEESKEDSLCLDVDRTCTRFERCTNILR